MIIWVKAKQRYICNPLKKNKFNGNKIKSLNLENLFPNILVALRIFATIPATVASAERSFSTLNRVKNVLRSTICQDRLSNVGVLAVETDLAREANLDTIIDELSMKKARKGTLLWIRILLMQFIRLSYFNFCITSSFISRLTNS